VKKPTTLILSLLCLSLHLSAQTTGKGLEGTWRGALDVGGQSLRLVLTVSKSADGSYSGKLESIDQGGTIPVDVITVRDDSARLELKTVDAVFEGRFNQDRSELKGEFTQAGAKFPLTLTRGGESAAQPPTAKPAPPQRPIDVPAEVVVPVPPTAFNGGGKTNICYELHITNFSRTDLVLNRLELIDGGNPETKLATYEGDALAARVARPGITANASSSTSG
jgi:hypothetical protein